MKNAERLERRCELYRGLLELSYRSELEPLLEEALSLIVQATGGERGLLRLVADPTLDLSFAHKLEDADLDAVRAAMSAGILSEALLTGEIVQTQSALLDPRFADRESVRKNKIEAVVCAPIGSFPPTAALYLQGHPGAGPFDADALQLVSDFARYAAPVIARRVEQALSRSCDDPTQAWRERLDLDELSGSSHALASVFHQLSMVAPLDVPVLLTGPSGSGKTALARALHKNGKRAEGPFVEVNCAAIPESLIESELFGSLEGAHSTATRAVKGKIAAAEGGTLLLDEVGELSPQAQAKLLTFLQSWTYYPLGGTEPCQADVRLVTATNVDLADSLREGRFREDLFYRLNVVRIQLPSLNDRRDDLLVLAERFARDVSERHGIPLLPLSLGSQRAIREADWPGNVRQLAHTVEGGLIRAAGSQAAEIGVEHLFPDEAQTFSAESAPTFQGATRDFQRDLIRRTLERNEWNKRQSAKELSISRSHLYNLMREHALTQPQGRS